jgi:hypothetical protein
MKKICVMFLILVLSGCSYIDEKLQLTPPQTPEQKTCSELKRNIVFNYAPSPYIGEASITQCTEMLKLYRKSGCDKVTGELTHSCL